MAYDRCVTAHRRESLEHLASETKLCTHHANRGLVLPVLSLVLAPIYSAIGLNSSAHGGVVGVASNAMNSEN